jgi:hypothetical protein
MLFHHEPTFEHAANVGVGLIALRSMARHAIAVATPPAFKIAPH